MARKVAEASLCVVWWNLDSDDINNYKINIVFSARKLAEASLNEHEKLDDIIDYKINIVLSSRKLAEASLGVVWWNLDFDDIDNYQIIIVLSARKLAEALLIV